MEHWYVYYKVAAADTAAVARREHDGVPRRVVAHERREPLLQVALPVVRPIVAAVGQPVRARSFDDVFVPDLGSGLDWSRIGERYRSAIARRLQETLLPDLEAHVVTSSVMTPQDFQDRLRSFRGAAFGLAPVFSQSAWFRPHNRSEDIDRLYLVGAGTHPGAGLPGVLSSARVLDAVVPDARALV